MSVLPASARAAPLHLWRIAAAFLNTLVSIFGEPKELAAEHTLTSKAYALALSWIRVGEAVLRHLLFLEAAALPAPPPSKRPAGESPAARVRKLMYFTADKPDEWRVCFRCSYGPPASRRHAPSSQNVAPVGWTPAVHKRVLSAWPLAERYEALFRVFDNPAPYAKRLARRLHARPALTESVLITTEHFAHRVDNSREFITRCESAKPTFANSS